MESELVLSRNPMLISSRQVRRLSILTSTRCTEVRNARTADDAETRYEHSLRHGESIDISSASPQSLHIKKYCVNIIPNTTLRYIDERHQTPDFGSLFCLAFDSNFWPVIRSAFIQTFKRVPFCFFIFYVLFRPNCRLDFQRNLHNSPPNETKQKGPRLAEFTYDIPVR